MAEFIHSTEESRAANAEASAEMEIAQQRRIASLVFDRVMTEGANRFGVEWLQFHLTIRDLQHREYLPTDQWGETDTRIKALFAEIAYTLLSKYTITLRKDSK